MSIADLILAKTPLPTALDSATIRARVAHDIREQAFFSAKMTLEGYLKDLQRLLAAYAQGSIDASALRVRARSKLAEFHYIPQGEGLKDHRSPARLNLILKTNLQMASGMAQRDSSVDPLLAKAFPAWELVSGGYRRLHRTDWPRRWQAAGDAVGWQGARPGKRMVALKSSPIWQALGNGAGGFRDTLGNPYPPFAFGSSYEWSELSILEAQDLGLVPKVDSALNKRDTHGHFATTEGEPCTHGGGKTEDEKGEEERKHQKVLSDILRGFRATCRLDHAIELLTNGINMNDGGGRPIKFVRYTRDHYTTGERRKGKKPKPKNLTYLPLVIHTLKDTTPIVRRPDGSESTDLNAVHPRGSQRVYSTYYAKRRFFVYVYHDSGVVSGWHLKD
jgi:hypothetical protein